MSDYDLLIIGAGPAGLTAAQYGARSNLKVVVIEQLAPGGQLSVIDVLENYPGNVEQCDEAGNVTAGVRTGYEFALDLHRQARNFGAEFFFGAAASIKKENDIFTVCTADGKILSSFAVIFAAGAKPRPLNVPGEKEFSGKGVSYCAVCDGNFFRGKKIFVAGGGDAACDEARYLSRLTDKVVLVHRRGSFRAQKALVQRTLNNPNIETRLNTVIKEIKGDTKVKSVLLASVDTGDVYEEDTDAVFIFTGITPQSSLAGELNVFLDENGYIITDQKMATNITGFFAAGDVRSGAFRQVITAAADGAVAANSAAGYINEK